MLLRLCLLLAFLLPPSVAAQPLASELVRTERVTAALVSEAALAAPGETIRIGLHLDLIPGWHTYWRNPGDSGAPTQLDWRLPEGVTVGEMQWPHPQALPYGPLVNYGYEDDVLHIMDLSVPADWPSGVPVRLEADAFWLVCADICIPEEGTLALALPTGPTTDGDAGTAALFERFTAQLPGPAPFAVTASGTDPLRLDVATRLERGAEVHFFPYASGLIETAAAQPVRRSGEGFSLRLTPASAPLPGGSERLDGVLVIEQSLGGQRFSEAFAVDVALPPGAAPAAGAAVPSITLALALLLAIAGGLLLNLMPCVLPVLSIKALAIVHSFDRGRARIEGVAYFAGVLVTFLLVAAALILARTGGAQVGWGFQLQSPVIVAALAYLLFVVGLNLSGLFQITGPAGFGGRWAGRGGAPGSFMTGALAVVVATPCTAPFMATALGFALVQPSLVTLAVFAALGVGMALPFLVISLVPGVARLLPKPGPWMERLRQGLAFPMYASAAWLVWVLAQQAGPNAVLAVLAGAVLIAFGLWLGAPTAGRPGPVGRGVGVAAAIAGLALLAVPATFRDTQALATEASTVSARYTPERLAAARAEGLPIFVEMTAAWCITCQVNERLALSGPAFEAALAETGTLYLVGDWTNRAPEVTAFIENFAHPGVPLYVVFPAAGGTPEILPQVLTPGIVRDALTRAAAAAA